jgi:hypothetical protein
MQSQPLVLARSRSAGLAIVAALALGACHTLSPRPATLPVTMAGNWKQDAAASDNFEAKLAEVIAQERQRLQPRHGAPVARGTAGGAPAQIEPLAMPQEEPDKERKRLADDLRPAETLVIAFKGDVVEITRDSDPVRSFQPEQTVSRIDTSGAARVTSGWNERGFEIHARYTNKAVRKWRLEVDSATDTLHLQFEANDPDFGRLVMQTVYRRVPQAPAPPAR